MENLETKGDGGKGEMTCRKIDRGVLRVVKDLEGREGNKRKKLEKREVCRKLM